MEYSESSEMYLKKIYTLSKKNPQIRATDVANVLHVSKASVNRAVKRLCSEGMLTHVKYGHIEMTDRGIKKAQEICAKQEIIADYLISALHVKPKLAMEEACKLEHILGSVVIKKMKQETDRNRHAAPGEKTC